MLEEERKSKIKQSVSQIYLNAVNTAKSSTYSKYLYEFSQHHPDVAFYRTNMHEILAEVQSLFPGCTVKHTVTYDVSEIDEQLKPYIMNQIRTSSYIEYIVVDWS
jgi:hypothetical protein